MKTPSVKDKMEELEKLYICAGFEIGDNLKSIEKLFEQRKEVAKRRIRNDSGDLENLFKAINEQICRYLGI